MATMLPTQAQLTLINPTTLNGSFELPNTGTKIDPFNGSNVTNWSIISGGTYTDSGIQKTGSSPTPQDGSWVGFLMNNDSGIYNLVPSASYTMTAGDQYTLTMYAAISSTSGTAGPDQLTLDLFSSHDGTYNASYDVATSVNSMPTSLGKYVWQEYTLTYTAFPTDDGNQIGVYVANTFADATHNHYMDIDDFTLTVTPAPEPSTYAMFFTGVLGLWGMRRFRRHLA